MSEAKAAQTKIQKAPAPSKGAETAAPDKGKSAANGAQGAAAARAGGPAKPGAIPVKPSAVRRRKGKVVLIPLAILLLLGAAAAALYFTGLINPLLEAAGLVESGPEQPAMSAEELAAWEEKLARQDEELKKKKEDLDLKEQQLADREKELNVKENNLKIYGQSSPHVEEYTQTFQEMLAGLNDDELSYIKRMSVVYAKMEPASAASIITQLYDIQKTSAILYYMLPEAAAKILEQMDKATAAEITEIILN